MKRRAVKIYESEGKVTVQIFVIILLRTMKDKELEKE